MIFNLGTKIPLQDGRQLLVKKELGSGAQGEVYLVELERKEYALKWYKQIPNQEFIDNLIENANNGSPSSHFIWPIFVIQNEQGVGFVMELIPTHMKPFVSYLNGKTQFIGWTQMVTFAITIVNAFKKLHARGLSYQDINDGGFFLDPQSGEALICDTDNVAPDQVNLGIQGVTKYMAPEVSLGHHVPDVHSDRYSVAILLFRIFTLGHPLEGNRIKDYDLLDARAEVELYASKPLFTYHPSIAANRPIRGYHTTVMKRWELIPSYIKEQFTRTFTLGISDRENERTTELEWIRLLFKYRDELVTCTTCQHEFTYFKDDVHFLAHCPRCQAELSPRLLLEINKNKVALEPGKIIFEPHIDKYSPHYDVLVGVVIANKINPKVWGIRNLSPIPWTYEDSHGSQGVAEPNGVIPLIRNLKIHFGNEQYGHIK